MVEKTNFLGGIVPTFREEYQERIKYKTLVDDPRLIDIWYENHGYGIINRKCETTVPIEDESIVKNFDGFADAFGALSFVADAFIAFRDDFIDKVNNSTIGFPPFIENMTPVKGYESFESLYADWSSYSAAKYSSTMQNNKNIDDYSCFLSEIKKIFIQELARYPITKSGFCLSRHNNILTTGLVIELANLDYDIDLQKGDMVQSFNFNCYLDLANAYGFYVDKNAPWRLICNLEHPTTRLFIRGVQKIEDDRGHQNTTTEEILDNIYRIKTHFDDLYVLQDFILKTYNQIIKSVPSYSKMVYNNTNNDFNKKNVFRKQVEFLSINQWIDLLVMVRLLELGVYSERKHKKIYDHVSRINDIYGIRQCLAAIGTEMASVIKDKLSSKGKHGQLSSTTQTFQTSTAPTAPQGGSNFRY